MQNRGMTLIGQMQQEAIRKLSKRCQTVVKTNQNFAGLPRLDALDHNMGIEKFSVGQNSQQEQLKGCMQQARK